jgi:dipeptidyl aminopeptidase/acylaminoacyl peptidase
VRCSDIFGFSRIVETAISPSGDAVAYVQRNAISRLGIYDWELRLTSASDPVGSSMTRTVGADLHGPAWAPDGRMLAVAEYRDGEPNTSIVLVSAVDGSKRRLVDGIAEPARITWSPDGAEVAFLAASRTREPEFSGKSRWAAVTPTVVTNLSAKIDGLGIRGSWQRHLFVVSCSSGKVRQLTDGDLWIDDFCYSPSSPLIALCGSAPWTGSQPRQPGAVRPSKLWLMRRRDGMLHNVPTGEADPGSLTFGPADQVIFTGMPGRRAGLNGLYVVSPEGGPVRRLAKSLDRGLVIGSAHNVGAEVIFCARDGGCVQLYRTSLRAERRPDVVAGSAAESITAVSTSQHGEVAAYVSSTPDGHQRLITRDMRTGVSAVLRRAEPPAEVLQAVRQEFTARDGLKLEGWLVRKEGSGSAPLLVDVHGGSFSGAWSPTIDPSKLYQQEMAHNGWTVLLLNSRGSDGYGSDFARAALGAWGQADGPDIHDAIDDLIKQGLVDPARLAITGYSYGGFMCNWLTSMTDRFSAAVAGGSICDFVSLFGTSDMGWAMSEYDIKVQPYRDPVEALRRSPIGTGRAVRTPTLLLHGEDDLRCPISQAEEWLATLLSAGCEAELVRYPGASHSFLSQGAPSLAADYGERLVKWVTRHVPSAVSGAVHAA